MAIRTRAVRPDMAFELASGEAIAMVSEDALLEEVVSVARMVNFAGGTMSLVVHRHPTGVPHEMVTVGALIQWQDRTDAKPQPEPAAPAQPVQIEPEDFGDALAEEIAARADEPSPLAAFEEDPEPEKLEERLEAEAREEHDDHPLAIPAEAVVMGAPVGAAVGPQDYAPPQIEERLHTHAHPRPPRQEGVGSGALPFQRGGEPTSAAPPEFRMEDIAHGSTSAPERGATPAAPGSAEGINDGLDYSSLDEEDDSSIPESQR